MADCLISFGSNLGDGRRAFADVLNAWRADPRIVSPRASEPYATRPIGSSARQANYVNAAIRFHTELGPADLLHQLLAIERRMGRVRSERWGARPVDLDLLLYGKESFTLSIDEGELQVPHPRMSFRRFVLTPAAEIAAEMVHPTSRMTIGELLAHLDSRPNTVAILGGREVAAELLDELANHVDDLKTTSANALEFSIERRDKIAIDEFPPTGSRFALASVPDLARFHEWRQAAKLLAYWRTDLEQPATRFVREALKEFAGPRLELESPNPHQSARELAAAIAAMLPQSLLGMAR